MTTAATSLSIIEAAAELHKLRSRISTTADEKWRTLDARDRYILWLKLSHNIFLFLCFIVGSVSRIFFYLINNLIELRELLRHLFPSFYLNSRHCVLSNKLNKKSFSYESEEMKCDGCKFKSYSVNEIFNNFHFLTLVRRKSRTFSSTTKHAIHQFEC